MSRILFAVVFMLTVFGTSHPAWPLAFNVSPTSDQDCSDLDCDLQSALNAASANDEGDTIYLSAGMYDASISPFAYITGKNYPITIIGSEGTVIDGSNIARCMVVISSSANAPVFIRNVTFRNCNAATGGGGLVVSQGPAGLTVEDCTFINNMGQDGGGLYVNANNGGPVIVRNSTFDGNEAANFAGGGAYIVGSNDPVVIENNLFLRNGSPGHGAGVYVVTVSGNIRFVNNVAYTNTAQVLGGGALLTTSSGKVTVINNTLTADSAASGGGIYLALDSDAAVANVYNNIIWNNKATNNYGNDIAVCDNCNLITVTATVNLRNNNFSDFFSQCEHNLGCSPRIDQKSNKNVNPQFVNVTDPDPVNWDLRLDPGSECIDAGFNAACPSTDIIGKSRPKNGDKKGTAVCDMGAYEAIPGPITCISPNRREEVQTGTDFPIRWAASPEVQNFKLFYSTDSGSTWKPITTGTITGTNYTWTVPPVQKNSTKGKVKIVGYNGSTRLGTDKSDGTFTIEALKLTYPDGGESFTSGSDITVTWHTYDIVGQVSQVRLSYSLDNGATWKAFASQPLTNTGSHQVTLPPATLTKAKCKVKVVLKDDKGKKVGSDTSDGVFTIHAAVP
jgi:hypothetical protein